MAKQLNFTFFELYISGNANPRKIMFNMLELLVWYLKKFGGGYFSRWGISKSSAGGGHSPSPRLEKPCQPCFNNWTCHFNI